MLHCNLMRMQHPSVHLHTEKHTHVYTHTIQTSLNTGPFAVLPGTCPPIPADGDKPPPCTITHMAPPEFLPTPTSTKPKGLLADTTSFFHLAVGYLQAYLNAPLPLPSLQQVFVPAPLTPRPAVALAGCSVLSAELLFSTRDVEPAVESRLLQVGCLARQWVGVLLRAARPWDEWLVDGLVGHLEEVFVRRYFGRNEALYRCVFCGK